MESSLNIDYDRNLWKLKYKKFVLGEAFFIDWPERRNAFKDPKYISVSVLTKTEREKKDLKKRLSQKILPPNTLSTEA